jgi:exodeoxyribonuclease VII large subunit
MNLFAEKRILTVSQLTSLIRGLLEENFEHLWVEGEVSNLATPSSGHLYFTLKDAGAAIRCVMFRSAANALKFRLADGMKLVLRGRMSVYDQRGDYQLMAEYLEPQGVGALQLAFQQLKERLAKEGLFAEGRKKLIPSLPATIGIVTSPTGAAIHDILNVINRRHANIRILIAPVKVQGEGAAAEIAVAVADLNSFPGTDVIIVARGGGSIEDLWAFNEEVVARAIAASRLPVISAIGHEVDITIADLVADLRAPTPSAAAELVVNSKVQMMADCNALERRLALAMQRSLSELASKMEILKLSLKDPEILIERFMQRLDDLQQRAESSLTDVLNSGRQRTESALNSLRFSSPAVRIRKLESAVENLSLRSAASVRTKIELSCSSYYALSGRLEGLSPLSILTRGYAAVRDSMSGKTVKGVSQLAKGDNIEVRFADGVAECKVNNIKAAGPYNLDSQFSEN